jgi:cytochrome d ubiquinol oxidase subunit I
MVYGVIRTAESASPVLGPPVAISLAAFLLTYTVVFGAGSYYILQLIGKGPPGTEMETYGAHGVKKPPLVTRLAGTKGGPHV